MFSQSIIRNTGQLWKLVLATIAMVVGSVAPLFSVTGMDWVSGTILACAGFAFASYGIACPNCGIRWFWKSMSNLELQGWLVWLVTRPTCPQCETDFRRNDHDGRD